jgi:hypothetical protein
MIRNGLIASESVSEGHSGAVRPIYRSNGPSVAHMRQYSGGSNADHCSRQPRDSRRRLRETRLPPRFPACFS